MEQGDRALRAAAKLGEDRDVITRKNSRPEKPAEVRTPTDEAISLGRNHPHIAQMTYAEMARGGHTGPRHEPNHEPSYDPFGDEEGDQE